ICDPCGDMLVQASHGNPSHIGALHSTLKNVLRVYPGASLRPGDVLVTNDPWIGNGHTPDFFVMTPVFTGGDLAGFVVTIVHHIDVGGRQSAAESREIYEEGIRLGPLRLYREGQENTDVFDIIGWNVRVPEKVIGDLRAQVSANHVGSRRIEAVVADKGWGSLAPLGHELIDRTEHAMREAIDRIPDGIYLAESAVDRHRGEPIVIRVAVEVRGSEIVIDYEGTSSQVDRAINVVFNYTNAHSIFAVKCMVARDLPNNEGCVRPITVRAPRGSILNAEFPVAVAQRAQIGHVLPDVIFQALAPAIPGGVLAGSGSNPLWSNFMSGSFASGRRFMLYFAILGGLGARAGVDGVSCLGFPANVSNTPIEVLEAEAPVICEQKRLATDSAGRGQFRGGLGQDFTMTVRQGTAAPRGQIIATLRGGHFEFPVQGILGGEPARNGEILFNGTPLTTSQQLFLSPGDSLTFRTPGGGGFGVSRERSGEQLAADLQEEYVSEPGARQTHDCDDLDEA
ncbi:MAG: hydantoinase B/oxoprolinase family protein, partial [Candidatus Rokubacteria bacterium]|nr:hydantoinase B/oxoprolinase family protein [Candidatus Rokubacteria bacterium]